MFKLRVFLALITVSLLMIFTSFIKNQTREIEKNIFNLNKEILVKEKDLNESELDLSYLTSPAVIQSKIENLDNENYLIMEFSKIYLSFSDFINVEHKFAIQENKNEKKTKKN